MIAPRLALGVAVALAACTSACSALLDWSEFTGGVGEAGDGGGPDATTDAPADSAAASEASLADVVAMPCGNGGTCAPNAPSGWMGPVSLYVGAAAAPPCDADASSLFDGMGDLVAKTATCASCGCGSPGNVTCAGPVVTLFEDVDCKTPLGMSVTPTSSCSLGSLATAAAVTVAGPVASGSCGATGGQATITPATWGTTARACPLAIPLSCSGGGLCVPAQAGSTSVCVMQSGPVTSCPSGYPSGPQVLYTGLDDSRGCSTCTCALSGASCSIASPAVDAFTSPPCTTPQVTMPAPTAMCTALTGAFLLELVATPAVSGQGSCAVSGGGSPTGTATGTGAMSFCCIP